MVVCASLVSTSFTVGRAITAELDPALLTLIRFSLAALLFAPFVYLRHGLRASPSLVLRCSLISCCLVSFFYCMFLSLRYTTALNTSIIFALVPSLSCIYAFLLVGEKLNRSQLIALACGMAGAVWVIFRGDYALLLHMSWNKGDLIFLGGCFAMGLYTPLIRLLHRGEPMVVMTFWIMVTGAGWLLFVSGYQLLHLNWTEVSAKAWLGILYLAVFCTIITFFLTQYAVPRLGPTKVMAYSYFYPGLVVVLELLLGHGLPPLRILPGVFVVLLAMFVLMRSQAQGGVPGRPTSKCRD